MAHRQLQPWKFLMNSSTALRICLAIGLGTSLHAHAESFASSASSAGSASSGSVSDSFRGSSNSSKDDDKKADGDYRIIEVADSPDRAGIARITMQADAPGQRIVLDLPRETFARQHLGQGDIVHAQHRVYGIEFARGDTREAFFLVLDDDWHGELAARPLSL